MERTDERKVAAPITGDRQAIQGVIVSIKEHAYRRFHWQAYTYTWKCTIKVETPDGAWFCWGTLPIATAQRGDVIRFVARLEGGADDEHFAFFKRPTGATIVRAAA